MRDEGVQGEAIHDIASLAAWIDFRDSNPELCDQGSFQRWADRVRNDGCFEPLTGWWLEGSWLEGTQASLREGLSFRGLCSRVRAVMLVIEQITAQQRLQSPAIYAAEAITPFALRLRGLFPRFLGSEFTLDPQQRRAMYPILFQDLQELTLDSDAFDIVSTNEVLEHVPSIDQALAEICRVLRPGGWHIGTVPFNYFAEASLRRAVLGMNGSVIHLIEPQYHGDPMNDKGVLVFETPGWDILERARIAGFSHATMRFVLSPRYGVFDEHIGGILVFCCQK